MDLDFLDAIYAKTCIPFEKIEGTDFAGQSAMHWVLNILIE